MYFMDSSSRKEIPVSKGKIKGLCFHDPMIHLKQRVSVVDTQSYCRDLISLLGSSRRSLRKVVEAHGHADVAGEADVDAEVDESLSPRAWRDERNMV
jgi:hypothetical protein